MVCTYLNVDHNDPGNKFRYETKETSLDGTPRGVHVDKDDFDIGAADSGLGALGVRTLCLSRSRKRVTDVRKKSTNDGCDQTARFR